MSLSLDIGLGHGICFGQWDIRRNEANRGLKYICTVGVWPLVLLPFTPRGTCFREQLIQGQYDLDSTHSLTSLLTQKLNVVDSHIHEQKIVDYFSKP